MIRFLLYFYALLIPIFNSYQGDRTFFLVYIIFLAALGFLSTIISVSSARRKISGFYLLLAVLTLCGLFGALLNFNGPDDLRFFFSVLYLGLIMLLVNGYLTQAEVWNMFICFGIGILAGLLLQGHQNLGGGRLSGEFVNSTDVSSMPAFVIVACYRRILDARSNILKALLAALATSMAYVAARTETRSTLVLLVLFSFYLILRHRRQILNFKYSFLVAVALAALIYGFLSYYHEIDKRMDKIGNLVHANSWVTNEDPRLIDRSIGYRVLAAEAGLEIFKNHVFGIGFGNFMEHAQIYMWAPEAYLEVGHPHNTYIEILDSTGIIGFLVFLVLISYLFKKLKNDPFMKMVLILLLVAAATDTLVYSKMLTLLFASSDVLGGQNIQKQRFYGMLDRSRNPRYAAPRYINFPRPKPGDAREIRG